MALQILEQLFDSPIKVRLLKLFLRNTDRSFSLKDIIVRIRSNGGLAKKQINGLCGIGFLKCKKINKAIRKKDEILKPGIYYSVDSNFEFFTELSNLVLKSSPASKEKLLEAIKRLGRIKLAVLAGVFLNNSNNRTDLLLVGDINRKKLEVFLSNLESEVGKEIVYSVMHLKEFDYRHQMFDRFIRDILEQPHEKLINKLKI